jgi:predicted TIM-barrel fold metal-dependent hydrolase
MAKTARLPRARTAAHLLVAALLALPVGVRSAFAQTKVTVDEYNPTAMLKVPSTRVDRARFPFVDAHGHQDLTMDDARLRALLAQMDTIGLAVMVNLSGGSGARLAAQVESAKRRAPGRFVVFANLDFANIDSPQWGANAAKQLEADVRQHGASGLKIFKNLGMDLVDGRGRRIPTDDPRFDPVWAKAGELGIPVLIHTAEPPAFFEPLDATNERYTELVQFPGRYRPSSKYPSFDSLLAEQHRMFRKHPRTTFINAHLGWLGGDLARLGAMLDALPNVYVEVAAALYEVARQPRYARAFFERYQDRILMGKDTFGGPDEFRVYFRIFETTDEYFPWYRRRHAFWGMYGLGLSDAVLRKVYADNARRIIPGIDGARFPR